MSGQTPSDSDPRETRDHQAIWYWAAVVGIVVAVWLAPAIPTQDGPSHRYNIALISDLLGDGPYRSNLHELRIESVTNLGFLAVALPIAKALPLWAVERFALSLHVVLIALFSTLWLTHTGRRTFPAAWVGLGFCFPWSLFMGFYGYQLGADIALVTLCLAWLKRDSLLLTLASLSLIATAGIVLFHAVAAALFAGLVGLTQLASPHRGGMERIIRAAAVSIPGLVIVAFAVLGGGDSSPPQWSAASYLFATLATFGMLSFSSQALTCLLVLALWLLLCLPNATPGPRDHAARFSFFAGIALVILHLTLPDRIGGGGYLTGRFAWWIPLVTLPLLQTGPAFAGRLQREWIPVAIAFVSIGSTLIGAAPDAFLAAEIEKAARAHPVTGTIATAIFDRNLKSDSMIEPLRHVSSLFVRDQGVLMTNYQARVPFFPLRFTEAAKARFPHIDINAAWETKWHRLPITNLLSIDANSDDRRILSVHFESTWKSEQNRVELWRKR